MKSFGRTAVAGLIYLLVIVIFFHVYFGSFSTALIGPPEDNMQEFWNTWYMQTKLDADPSGLLHTDKIFYPEGASLVYHSFSYPNLVAIYLVRCVVGLGTDVGTLIFLHNFFLLISFFFGALGAYLLTRLYVRSEALAVLSGFIFGFSPFHLAHTLHHMHVSAITFVPFFVYFFLRYMREKKVYLAAAASVMWALAALSCWYYLVYIGYFVLFYYVFHAVKNRSLMPGETLLPAALITFFALFLLSPLIVTMILQTGARSYLEGHDFFVADLLGFITFHPYHLLAKIGRPLYSHFQGNHWEMTVYLGLANVAVLLFALFKKYCRKIENLGFFQAGILLFMLLALGSWLHVGGYRVWLPLPTLLTEYIPVLKNVRTPSRAVIFVYLFTGVSVAMIAEYFLAGRKKITAAAAVGILAIVTFADFFPTGLDSTPVVCPPAYALINEDRAGDFGMINLPAGYLQDNKYMMQQAACSPVPMANGSIGRKLAPSLIDTLDFSDFEAQKAELKRDGIKYILIHKKPADETVYYVHHDRHTHLHRLHRETLAREMAAEYQRHYQLVHEDEMTALLQVYH